MPISPEKQALKTATARLIRAAGGQEAAVAFTELSRHQALSEYASPAPEHAHRFARIDVVADLEAVSHGTPGHPVVTRQLARAAGFLLVPMPGARGDLPDLGSHLSAIIRETADVTLNLSLHLNRDAAASPSRLRSEVAQAIQALVELDAALSAAAD